MAACCRAANPRSAVVPCENLAAAFAGAAGEKFIVVTGSIHFIGEAMEFLGLVPPSAERALNDYLPSPLFHSAPDLNLNPDLNPDL